MPALGARERDRLAELGVPSLSQHLITIPNLLISWSFLEGWVAYSRIEWTRTQEEIANIVCSSVDNGAKHGRSDHKTH